MVDKPCYVFTFGFKYDAEIAIVKCKNKEVAKFVAANHKRSPYADEPDMVDCRVGGLKMIANRFVSNFDKEGLELFNKWDSTAPTLDDGDKCLDLTKHLTYNPHTENGNYTNGGQSTFASLFYLEGE